MMKVMPSGEKIVADFDLWEFINKNQQFNDFVGQCVTHFTHFVVPRRDQTNEIAQDYPVPLGIDDVGGDRIVLTRKDGGNVIFIEFWR